MRRQASSAFRQSKFELAALLSIILSLGATGRLSAQEPASAVAAPAALVAEVLFAPQAVTGSDAETHLVYELKLTNTNPAGMTLTDVTVFDPDTQRGYSGFTGISIKERLRIPDVPLGQTTIPPGQWGVFFVHVAVPPTAPFPGRLSHVVVAASATSPGNPQTTMGGETTVVRTAPVVLGPPLRGSGYIAGDGCCDAPRHVQSLLPIEGGWWNAQRFAIDWEQLDDHNRLWLPQAGRGPIPQDFHIYGKDLLAVADGSVIAVVKNLPDQPTGQLPPNLPLDQADGNHVILDIGNGVFVLYAHMAPGSVAVDLHQQVRKGQLLGKVGNSGNTTAPHLHMQAMDRPSSLAANGLPYVFADFRLTGFDPLGSADFQKAEDDGTPATITPLSSPTTHLKQLPLNVVVVDWQN